jgi:anaerobic selenocysteine-containing dehydrogenase
MLTERLARIRATDPEEVRLFTGRDQMQALTGLFARQFGTPNYAAHGGFCSVNMAAGHDLHDRRLVLGIRRPDLDARSCS